MHLLSLFPVRTSGRVRASILTAAGTLAAGCTTVQSEPIAAGSAAAATGLVYYLPIRTLAVDAKFQILDCGRKPGSDTAELLYDVSPTVTSGIAADRSRAFAISRGLDGKILKSLNFETAEYENGTLKGINLVADDRTAETATNVLSGALKFGLALTGVGGFSGKALTGPGGTIWLRYLDEKKDAAAVESVREVCGPAVTDALLKVHALTRELSGSGEATAAKAKVTGAVAEAEKAVTEARAALKAAKDAGGEEDLTQAKQVLTEAVATLVTARAAAKAAPSAAAGSAMAQDMAAIVQRYLTFNASDMIIPSERPIAKSWTVEYPAVRLQKLGINTATSLVAKLSLQPLVAPSEEDAVVLQAQQAETGRSDGIWVRSPATALLRVCVTDVDCGPATYRLSQLISVPQWGQLSRIPLKNMAFAKNTTKIALAPDGTLLSLSSDATSAAERASGAFAQSGDMVLDFVTKRRALQKELADADTAADKAAIQNQIDMLNLNQQLTAAQSTIGPERQAQLSAIDFQIQQTQKQIDLLELQKKLQALQAAPQ